MTLYSHEIMTSTKRKKNPIYFFGYFSLKLHALVRRLSSGLHSLVNSETFLFQYENKPLLSCTMNLNVSKQQIIFSDPSGRI